MSRPVTDLRRTTGLPDFKEEGLEPLAALCLADEVVFLAVWIFALQRRHMGQSLGREGGHALSTRLQVLPQLANRARPMLEGRP